MRGPDGMTRDAEARKHDTADTITPGHSASEGIANGAYPVVDQTHHHGPWCGPDWREAQHLADPREDPAAGKAYSDAIPGPGTYPRPVTMRPVAPRPVLMEGHAAVSPGYDGPRSAEIPLGMRRPAQSPGN